MKNPILSMLAVIFCISIASGEVVQVTMRSSESKEKIRFVFEADEAFLKERKVYHAYSLIKVEFPSEFNFVAQSTPKAVEISHKGKSLSINIVGLKDIDVFMLTGPPRLVIDAMIQKGGAKETQIKDKKGDKLSELADRIIVVDPGHGGYNIGLVGGDYKEKDIVLSVAKSLRYIAKRSGAKVFLTRWSDKYITIGERRILAYEKRPEFFFSLHLSSNPDFVVYFLQSDPSPGAKERYELSKRQFKYLKESKLLAKSVAVFIKERFRRAVKIKQMHLPLLSSIDSPGIVIEMPDGKYFEYSSSNRHALVSAILKGIIEYERK